MSFSGVRRMYLPICLLFLFTLYYSTLSLPLSLHSLPLLPPLTLTSPLYEKLGLSRFLLLRLFRACGAVLCLLLFPPQILPFHSLAANDLFLPPFYTSRGRKTWTLTLFYAPYRIPGVCYSLPPSDCILARLSINTFRFTFSSLYTNDHLSSLRISVQKRKEKMLRLWYSIIFCIPVDTCYRYLAFHSCTVH